MGLAALLRATERGQFTLPPPPTEPLPRPGGYPDGITRAIAEQKAALWIGAQAEAIPPVRRALSVIVGTISCLTLAAWRNDIRLPDSAFPWLAQPDPTRTSQRTLSDTIRDGIWTDRAVWRRTPGGFYRVAPDRVTPAADSDPDRPPAWLLDGKRSGPDELVVFDFAGMGGLRRFGRPLLDMYTRLMLAAVKYADEPVPPIILKNTGADIENDEIDALIDRWEQARALGRTGFLNAYLTAETPSYTARDVQLVQVMDGVTKDVARLFGLPGWAIGAPEGDSMTYSNVTDRRRDLVESLRPWSTPVEQTLSLTSYGVTINDAGATAVRRGVVVPYGTDVRFDTSDYLRDGFAARISALTQASGGPIMTTAEARQLEPTITDPTGALPNAPAPA